MEYASRIVCFPSLVLPPSSVFLINLSRAISLFPFPFNPNFFYFLHSTAKMQSECTLLFSLYQFFLAHTRMYVIYRFPLFSLLSSFLPLLLYSSSLSLFFFLIGFVVPFRLRQVLSRYLLLHISLHLNILTSIFVMHNESIL